MNRFKIARNHLGLTQLEVSEEIQISKNSVSKNEQNDKIDKPNVHYVNFLRKKGINQEWLLYGSGEMLDKNNNILPSDYEEVKKENRYLRNKVEQLENQMNAFLVTINHLSGKPSGHKHAANLTTKKNSSKDLAYAPYN